jgi:hypothetical protein
MTGWAIYGNEVSKTYFFEKSNQSISQDYQGEKKSTGRFGISGKKIILTIKKKIM